MPFIVQCPHLDCRKYMLLEDAARGMQIECLVCKRLIHVDPSSANDSRETPALPHALEEAAMQVQRQHITHCPQCQGPMRVPPGRQGKKIQCPHCRHVFLLKDPAPS